MFTGNTSLGRRRNLILDRLRLQVTKPNFELIRNGMYMRSNYTPLMS